MGSFLSSYRSSCRSGIQSTVLLALLPVLLLTGCQNREHSPVLFSADNYPPLLSQWQLLAADGEQLLLDEELLPYDLRMPLFSDYAQKLRTVWMPDGTTANFSSDEVFDFPPGTIISKTFYYPRVPGADDAVRLLDTAAADRSGNALDLQEVRLIETRLLVRQEAGWDALPYVWDAQQQEAHLQPVGAIVPLRGQLGDEMVEFTYVVPNRNECAACHVIDQNQGLLQPIGPAARHLDRDQQLQQWASKGWLVNLPDADADPDADAQASAQSSRVAAQARAYLDINCAHCHQPGGSADTSGLFLNATETSALPLGICKPPVAAGRGTGGHNYSIVPGLPDESILLHRMQSQELDIQMPELGRTLLHQQGIELLREWIEQLEGSCL